MEEQEKQRKLEELQKEMLKEWQDKEAGIIKEELSLSLEKTYVEEAAIMLIEINNYIPNYAQNFKEGASKLPYYMKVGHSLLESVDIKKQYLLIKKL